MRDALEESIGSYTPSVGNAVRVPGLQLPLGDDVDPTYASLPLDATLVPQGCSTRRTEHTGPQPPHHANQSQRPSHPPPSGNSQSKYLFYEDKEDTVREAVPSAPTHMAVVPIHQPCAKNLNFSVLPHAIPYNNSRLPPLHPLSPLSLSRVSLAVGPPSRKSKRCKKEERRLKRLEKESKEKAIRETRFNRCYLVVIGVMVLLIALCGIASVVLTRVA